MEQYNNTTDLILEMFKTSADKGAWENHIKFASLANDISEEQKIELIEAIKFLKNEFGKGFLKNNDWNHPVCRMILNKAPWSYSYMINFAETLRKLKEITDSNYSKLLDKLLAYNSCDIEGIPFIDIANSFMSVGCIVKFPNERVGQPNPDLEINDLDTGDTIYIEISSLRDSNEKKRAAANFDLIQHKLCYTNRRLPHSCIQLNYITDDEMPEILEGIDKAINEASRNEKGLIFYQTDKINLVLSHTGGIDCLNKWCHDNNRRLNFSGLPVNYDETQRILNNNKIKQEARQIPKNGNGLLYFPVHPLSFFQINFNETIKKFNEKMIDFPNLIGIVMYSYIISSKIPCSHRYGAHFYGIKIMNDIMVRDLLFIHNDHYKGIVSRDTISKIYQSFL